MAKKTTTVIEFRFDKADPWIEYGRTQVPSMIDHYEHGARSEYPGAEVRHRPLK